MSKNEKTEAELSFFYCTTVTQRRGIRAYFGKNRGGAIAFFLRAAQGLKPPKITA